MSPACKYKWMMLAFELNLCGPTVHVYTKFGWNEMIFREITWKTN